MNSPRSQRLKHHPVLLNEVLNLMSPRENLTYWDATAGFGGHARAIAQRVGWRRSLISDADPASIASLKSQAGFNDAELIVGNFADLASTFLQKKRRFDLILADLGLSTLQLSLSGRGFSFLKDEPLDMRFNGQKGRPVSKLIERATTKQLTTVLRQYGQEPLAARIAVAIKRQRPQSTQQLAQLVVQVKKSARRRIHPATQTFMALRIWVNDELIALQDFLESAPPLLTPGGKLAIISFHSLEDRLVKTAFRDLTEGKYNTSYALQGSQPIIPSTDEVKAHPQARSARLRCLARASN